MRARTAVGFVLTTMAMLSGAAAPAIGADETNIDYVEVTDDGVVSILLAVDGIPDGAAVDPTSVKVKVGDEIVPAEARQVEGGEVRRTTVLALDASLSMGGTKFTAAKSAAQTYLDAAPPDVAVGLVTFSREPQAVTAPTTSRETVAGALESLTLTRGTGVYDAIIEAVELSGEEGARSVLLLSDGRDVSSRGTVQDAVDAAQDRGVVVDVVALDQDPQSQEILAGIATPSGGRMIPADPAALADLFAQQARALASQLVVSFRLPSSVPEEANLEVAVSAGGQEYLDSAFVSLASAATAKPKYVDPGKSLLGEPALWAGVAALGLGLAGLLVVVMVGSSRHAHDVQQQMAFYTGATPATQPSGPAPSQSSLRQTAVAATAKLVNRDFETRVAQRLNGAGLNVTAAEWLLIHAGICLGAALLGLVFGGGPLMVMLGLAGLIAPWAYLKVRHSRRLAAFNSQLAETLQLISGGLSAGLSLPQAIDTVVREGQEPVAGEMRRALIEQRLGVDIADALDGIADRMESKDFSWVIMAVRIQREVGGNLAELLITVADTLRERDYLRGQVKVLSAEGRISAWVLGGLPILMFLYMLLVRRDFVRPLYTEPLGLVLSGIALTLVTLGFWTMSRLVKIEV